MGRREVWQPRWREGKRKMQQWRAEHVLNDSKTFILLLLSELFSAFQLIIFKSLVSVGTNGNVLTVYIQTLATVLLVFLAAFVEKGRRPPLSCKIVGYSIMLGLLQIAFCQQLISLSLNFLPATYTSIALNMQMVVVFVLAVVFGQEKFRFCSLSSQAKLWGVLVSIAGAMVMVLWQGPAMLTSSSLIGDGTLGRILLLVAVFGGASWKILVRRVTEDYPAELSLAAMMYFWGTIQSAIVTANVVPRTNWVLKWNGGHTPVCILLGAVTGLCFYIHIWCIHKKGPVFVSSFTPLFAVFTFLLEVLFKQPAHLGSMVGAALVVMGLYLIIWGKAKEQDAQDMVGHESLHSSLV